MFIQRIAFDHGHIFEFYLKFMMWLDLHQNLNEIVYLVILGLCLTQICWWVKISLVDYSLIYNPKINFINELLSKFDVDFALFLVLFFQKLGGKFIYNITFHYRSIYNIHFTIFSICQKRKYSTQYYKKG